MSQACWQKGLHVHTTWSMDAYVFGTRTTPAMQLRAPLDFQAVTDHAIYLGMMPAMADASSSVGQHDLAVRLREAKDPAELRELFNAVLTRLRETRGRLDQDDLYDPAISRDAWAHIVESAERHDAPGEFTTFIAYEYSASGPSAENLHRNLVFAGGDAPAMPFSASMSVNPEDLWDWMDAERAAGRDALAMPHNSNGSDGWMFELTNQADEPIDAAYAEQRMRNEPLAENTQAKGTSDTHPALPPNDEWAEFEIMPVRVGTMLPSRPQGSYVRDAWLNGLAMEAARGFNPYRFGVIGASDTHVAAGSFEEADYWGKLGLLDATPVLRGAAPLPAPGPEGERYADTASRYYGAAGLAVAWAESNTRESLFSALRRKETYSTSGPRILLRFFGGHRLPLDIATRDDAVAQGYGLGVPMGADLPSAAKAAPTFFCLGGSGSALRAPATRADHQGLGGRRRNPRTGL